MLTNSTFLKPHGEVTRAFERMLQNLAKRLDISDTHYQSAERSYQSVSRWLNRPESRVAKYAPSIYSQGSFRLGTVSRPPTDEDCFDLDIVCEANCSKDAVTQEQLKAEFGAELAKYAKKHGMDDVEPGQFCWTLHYAEGAQFQMDVLPAVPDATYQRRLLQERNLGLDWVETAIGLTNTKHPEYAIVSRDWHVSNPRGYSRWFRKRMDVVFNARRRAMALTEGKADIEAIPEYRVKTPLQAAIQVLKRHRDGTFSDRQDVKPASIVITTLAAHAYNQEETLVGALFSILSTMDRYIEDRHGTAWIPNPTDARENFADRWSREPALKDAFYEWLDAVRSDFNEAAELNDNDEIAERLSQRMGRALMEGTSTATSTTQLVQRGITALSRIMSAPHKQAPAWPTLGSSSFAVSIKSATVSRRGFRQSRFASNGPALAKDSGLKFEADTNVSWPYEVYWQVVNTGTEALNARCPRGTFESARVEHGLLTRRESTRYAGSHSIECFIVKNGYCVARSGPFIVNIK